MTYFKPLVFSSLCVISSGLLAQPNFNCSGLTECESYLRCAQFKAERRFGILGVADMDANTYHDNWLNVYLRRPFNQLNPNGSPEALLADPDFGAPPEAAFLQRRTEQADKGAPSTIDRVGYADQVQIRNYNDPLIGSSAPDLWGKGEILLVGDSQLFWSHDQTTFTGSGAYFDQMVNQTYVGPGMRNFSAPGVTFIGGERIIDQLHENGPPANQAPAALYIQLGNADLAITWNICQSERAQSLETSLEYYARTFDAARRFQQKYGCPVFVISIHPNADPTLDVNDWDRHFNRGVQELCRQYDFTYVDTFSFTLNNAAETVREMFGISQDGNDPGHFTFRGYWIFREILYSHFFPTVDAGEGSIPLEQIADVGFREKPYADFQLPGLLEEDYRWFLVPTPPGHITQITTNPEIEASIAIYNIRSSFSPTNANGQWYGTTAANTAVIQLPNDNGERKMFYSLVVIGTSPQDLGEQTVELTHLYPLTDGGGVPLPGGFPISSSAFYYDYAGATYPDYSGGGLLGLEFAGPRVTANTGALSESEYYSRWLIGVVPPFSDFTVSRAQNNCPDVLGVDLKGTLSESAANLPVTTTFSLGQRRDTYTNTTAISQVVYLLSNYRTANPNACGNLSVQIATNPNAASAGNLIKFY